MYGIRSGKETNATRIRSSVSNTKEKIKGNKQLKVDYFKKLNYNIGMGIDRNRTRSVKSSLPIRRQRAFSFLEVYYEL